MRLANTAIVVLILASSACTTEPDKPWNSSASDGAKDTMSQVAGEKNK